MMKLINIIMNNHNNRMTSAPSALCQRRLGRSSLAAIGRRARPSVPWIPTHPRDVRETIIQILRSLRILRRPSISVTALIYNMC